VMKRLRRRQNQREESKRLSSNDLFAEMRRYHLQLHDASRQERGYVDAIWIIENLRETYGSEQVDRYIDWLDEKMKNRSYIAARTEEERKIYSVNLRRVLEANDDEN